MRRRIFEIDRVQRPSDPRLRRIMAKYVVWTEVFGYIFVTLVASAIVVCWFYKVDEVASEKDVGKSTIKPYEEDVTHPQKSVITRVLVEDWQTVRPGDPVVEICDDEDYVRRSEAMRDLQSLVDTWTEWQSEGRLPQELTDSLSQAQRTLEDWEKHGKAPPRSTVVRAPIGGTVGNVADLEGKIVDADATLFTISDFNDLRLAVTFSGKNVERIRVGMRVNINVQPRYGSGLLLRVDTRPTFLRPRRLQFNQALDEEETGDFLLQWLGDRLVATKEDLKRHMVLRPISVTEIEILAKAESEFVDDGQKTSRTSPPGFPDPAQPEPLNELVDIPGEIVSGKHTATIRTNFLSDEMRRELERRMHAVLGGKVVEVPAEQVYTDSSTPKRKGSDEPERVRIKKIERPRIFVKMKAEMSDVDKETLEKLVRGEDVEVEEDSLEAAAWEEVRGDRLDRLPPPAESDELHVGIEHPGWWTRVRQEIDRAWERQSRSAIEVEKVDRFFVATVRIQSPPPLLRELVEELAKQDPPIYLKAKVEAVVDKRRLAMLLFRQ